MVKTEKETMSFLKDLVETQGLKDISEAAMYVLDHYQDYDYNGSDRLFLAFCETIVLKNMRTKDNER